MEGSFCKEYTCAAEQLVDAKLTSKRETLLIIEELTQEFLQAVASDSNPKLSLINRSDKNVVWDQSGCLRLGQVKVTKKLFSKNGVGAERYAKIWQVLALVQRLLLEEKVVTQREAYYCLTQHFKNQAEFNDTLQGLHGLLANKSCDHTMAGVMIVMNLDVVALTGCARSALGLCASSSGAIAGCLTWTEEGDPIDCTNTTGGKRIPGVVEGVKFESLGARCILVIEKDAVFTYLCSQRIWDSLPCILVTGCGYPPLSVRSVVKRLSDQLQVPLLGLFDYNPHGVRILLTYKHGSTRMGMEAHSYAVDIKWLGVHYGDIFDSSSGQACVEASALQQWGVADERVYTGISSHVALMDSPHHIREVELMGRVRLKAEIEALNNKGFDSLEQKIIQKILRKQYF